MIFLYICPFLLPVFFRDHKIHIPDGFQQLFSFFIGKIAFLLLLIPVEFVCGKSHDQIVSILLGSAKQVNVPIVKQIKGSIGNYSFHFIRKSPQLHYSVNLVLVFSKIISAICICCFHCCKYRFRCYFKWHVVKGIVLRACGFSYFHELFICDVFCAKLF